MIYLIAILVFGLLILVHELGHFLTARAVGMKVKEFAIGFGPAIFKAQRGDTLYGIRIFPLGGYVRVLGEEGEEAEEEGSYQSRSVLQRFLFVFAGAFMNFVLAFVLFMIIFIGFGRAANIAQLGTVEPGSIADQAGFVQGDHILSVDGEEVNTWDELVAQITGAANQELSFRVLRSGETVTITATPQLNPETQRAMIGIGPTYKSVPFFTAIKESAQETLFFGTEIVRSLFLIITRQAPADVAGPVGIISMVGETARLGLASLMYFTALLSVNLAIFNLLPIPALDGSRLVFILVEAIRGKPVNPEKEGMVHIIGFFLLIMLMIIVLYKDILNLL